MALEPFFAWAIANPVPFTILSYGVAAALVMRGEMFGINNIPVPLVNDLNLAGAIVVGSSLFLFAFLDPVTPLERIVFKITDIVGIGVGAFLIFNNSRDVLT